MKPSKSKINGHRATSFSLRHRRLLVLLVLLAVAAGYWGWSNQIRRRQLLAEAERLLDTDPRRAAFLAEQATAAGTRNDPDGLLLWCRALVRRGAWEESLGCFSLIPEPSRLKGEKLLQLAKEAHARGISVLTTLALEAVPESDPHASEAVVRLMAIKLQQGRTAEAVELGRRITVKEPDFAEGWFHLAQGLDQIGNPPEAAKSYAVFLEKGDRSLSERRLFALRRLRRLSIDLGDFDQARACVAELQTSNADRNSQDAVDEAAIRHVDGEIAQALATVNSVLAEEPANVAALELRANIAIGNRDDVSAERDLRRLLDLSPRNKQAHYQLALLLSRSGRTDDAAAHFAENRRLTVLSTRIVSLQSQSFAEPEQERKRLGELADAYEQLGQDRLAAQLRSAVQRLESGLSSTDAK